MQARIPAVIMRGGTSKAVFFHDNHLPRDPEVRQRLILAAFGSPDANRSQIDGLGGAASVTSKVAIISPSLSPDYDVVYDFGQVAIDRPLVDFRNNCGNISSAVGPFAVDEGLVSAGEPITRVRIYQKNTDKLIVAEVPVKDGVHDEEGDYAIDGVPGTGSRIDLHFHDPGGAVTGSLLPTGKAAEVIDLPGRGEVSVSIVDAANPVVFARAVDLGLRGVEINKIDASEDIKAELEAIRVRAAVMIGLAASPSEAALSQAVPKIALVAPPQEYESLAGRVVRRDQIDLVVRMMSMGMLHKAIAITGAICAAGAALICGSVVQDALDGEPTGQIRLGHPGGVVAVGAKMERTPEGYFFNEAVVGRTARRLMEGYVRIPLRFFAQA